MQSVICSLTVATTAIATLGYVCVHVCVRVFLLQGETILTPSWLLWELTVLIYMHVKFLYQCTLLLDIFIV